MSQNDADDLPNLDEEYDLGGQCAPPGTYEIDVISLETYDGQNEAMKGDAIMCRLTYRVADVVHEDTPLSKEEQEKEQEYFKYTHGVKAGQVLTWQGKIGPFVVNRKTGQKELPYDCAKNAGRVQALIQSILRFEPGSQKTKDAVERDGSKVSWNKYFNAAKSEKNPFEGKPVRMVQARVKTKNHTMITPSFAVSSRVQVRESNVLDSL